MNGEQAYQNAMKRRDELRQELDEVETFLRLYGKYVSFSATIHAKSAIKADLTVKPADDSAPIQEEPLEHVAGMALVPHIRSVILDIGRPLSRRSVVKALSDGGIQVGGQDPAQNVATIMWRAKDEFVNLKPHGYWPRDVAYAPAGYNPAQNAETDDAYDDGSAATAEAEERESDEGDLWRTDRPAA